MSGDVAIIGTGLHLSGRHGDKLALDMGAEAARSAMADAGIECSSVQTAFVGSCEVSNPDAIVGWLGLEGIPVLGVFNGCTTAGALLQMAAAAIRNGETDIAMAMGLRQASARSIRSRSFRDWTARLVRESRALPDHALCWDEGQSLHGFARDLSGNGRKGRRQEP